MDVVTNLMLSLDNAMLVSVYNPLKKKDFVEYQIAIPSGKCLIIFVTVSALRSRAHLRG